MHLERGLLHGRLNRNVPLLIVIGLEVGPQVWQPQEQRLLDEKKCQRIELQDVEWCDLNKRIPRAVVGVAHEKEILAVIYPIKEAPGTGAQTPSAKEQFPRLGIEGAGNAAVVGRHYVSKKAPVDEIGLGGH